MWTSCPRISIRRLLGGIQTRQKVKREKEPGWESRPPCSPALQLCVGVFCSKKTFVRQSDGCVQKRCPHSLENSAEGSEKKELWEPLGPVSLPALNRSGRFLLFFQKPATLFGSDSTDKVESSVIFSWFGFVAGRLNTCFVCRTGRSLAGKDPLRQGTSSDVDKTEPDGKTGFR